MKFLIKLVWLHCKAWQFWFFGFGLSIKIQSTNLDWNPALTIQQSNQAISCMTEDLGDLTSKIHFLNVPFSSSSSGNKNLKLIFDFINDHTFSSYNSETSTPMTSWYFQVRIVTAIWYNFYIVSDEIQTYDLQILSR